MWPWYGCENSGILWQFQWRKNRYTMVCGGVHKLFLGGFTNLNVSTFRAAQDHMFLSDCLKSPCASAAGRLGIFSWVQNLQFDQSIFYCWLFDIAMDNDPFIDDVPSKNGDVLWLCSITKGIQVGLCTLFWFNLSSWSPDILNIGHLRRDSQPGLKFDGAVVGCSPDEGDLLVPGDR